MKEQILELVKERDNVSFAELSREVPGFSGNYVFSNLALKNIVLWDNISQEGVETMKELLSNSEIFIKETESLVYVNDGFLSPYPIAAVAKSYKTTHWLPVVFSCNRPN